MIGSLAGAFSFVSANQADPWWLSGGIPAANCIAAYQPKGAASLAASYVNLANPGTYNAAPGVAPTWDTVSGWIFTTAKYLKTGVIPLINYSVIIRFSDVTETGTKYMLGCSDGSNYFTIVPQNGTTPFSVVYRIGGSSSYSKAPGLTSGILSIVGQDGYRGTTKDITSAGGTFPNYEIYINGVNVTGFFLAPTAFKCQAFAIYSINITAYLSELNTAMAAL